MKTILLTLLLVSHLFSKDTLVLCSVTEKHSYNSFYLKSVFQQVADSLHMTPYFYEVPNKRSVEKLRNGTIMVDMARSMDFINMNTDLIPIPVLVGETKFMAISCDTSLVLNGWNSLLGKGYRVDYVRGTAFIEQNLNRYNIKENVFPQNSIKQCIDRLLINRCDLIILMEYDYDDWTKKSPELAQKSCISGTIASVKAYPVLSPKHVNLKEPLIRILSNLRSEGILSSLWKNLHDEWRKKASIKTDQKSPSEDQK